MSHTNPNFGFESLQAPQSNVVQNHPKFDAFTNFGMHISSDQYFVFARGGIHLLVGTYLITYNSNLLVYLQET